MKGFILGVIVAVAAIILVGLFIAETGRVDMRADQAPPHFERRLAGAAKDASVDRNAPKLTNPLQPTDDTLIAGAKIYADHCALCHGDPAHPTSPLAESFYPRAPQFMSDAADMGDRDNHYITEHGVRWTGMPAWGKVLSTNELWQVVTFIGHMDNLPADAKAVFALQAAPSAATPSKKPAEKPVRKVHKKR